MFPFFPVPMDVAQQAYVQARAEERIRTGNDVTAEESEIQPQVRYDYIWERGESHFVAIYNPRLVFTHTFSTPTVDPNQVSLGTVNTGDANAHPLSTLHNGGLGLEVLRRRYRLSMYQFAAYGPITTTALLVQAPWLGDGPPPDPQVIVPSTIGARFTLLFLQTQVLLPIKLTPRVALTPSFVYNAFGGADSEARAIIALTSGPGASIALDADATRDDRFTTTVGGGQISTAFEADRTGPLIYRAEATQGWRHYYSRRVSSEVAAGGSMGGDAVAGYSLYGVASFGLYYDSWPFVRVAPGDPPQGALPGHGDRVQLALIAKATPWIDTFSGDLEERGVGIAALNYTTGRLLLRGQLSVAKVINTPESVAAYQIVLLDAGARYALAPTFSVDGGLRFGFQDFSNAIRESSITQTTVYAGLTWAPLPDRF